MFTNEVILYVNIIIIKLSRTYIYTLNKKMKKINENINTNINERKIYMTINLHKTNLGTEGPCNHITFNNHVHK